MLLELTHCLLLFLAVTFGLAWPLAARLKLDRCEQLVASVMLSWVGVYLAAFAGYLNHLPKEAYWVLPGLAAAGLLANARAVAAVWREPDARALLVGQLLVSGWCLGWLWFVSSYNGGGWTSDWFEHWERTLFFLDRWPTDAQFLGVYALPARPPLANVTTGFFLALTQRTFAHYQLFTVLLNTLAFLPAALLVRRFRRPGAPAAIGLLAVLLMLNPSFVENATFAWTKLAAVFFILGGLYFFLRALDAAAPRAAGPLCALSLAAAVLTHYSAGPYVLLLGLAWVLIQRGHWTDAAFWRQTAALALVGGLVLATWFGWSLTVYGAHTTLLSNSSVTVKDVHSGNQLLRIALNLRDTIVPHFLRPLDGALIAQTSRWGYWHDWLFQLYQVNLFFIFGSLAWLALLREGVRVWPAAPRARWFWALFVGGAVGLGVAVHGARDVWGLAHICLQSIAVLGLAFLAARWSELGRGWRTDPAAAVSPPRVSGRGLGSPRHGHVIVPGVQPAIDRQLGADAVLAIVTGQKGRRRADIFGVAGALGGIDPEALVIQLTRDIGGVGQGRVDAAGVDRVDADAARPQFQRHRLGEPAHGELGGAVDRQRIGPGDPVGRTHVDHRPAACALQRRDGQLGAVDHAHQVDVDQAADLGLAQVFEPLEDDHPGIVDQNIELAKAGLGGVEHRLPLGAVGHVMVVEGGGFAQRGGQRRALGIQHVADHHPRALGHEPPHDPLADSTCTAGNQCYLARQPIHPHSSICFLSAWTIGGGNHPRNTQSCFWTDIWQRNANS